MRRGLLMLAATLTAAMSGCAASTTPVAEPTTPSAQPSTVSPSPAPTTAAPTATPTATSTATSVSLPPWLREAVVARLPTTSRVVALTFDGGSGAQGAAAVVAALKAAHVPAAFFLTGDFARSFPHVVSTISAGGYVVGNHTMSHPHLTQLSSTAVTSQISAAEHQLDVVIGGTRRPWFRFPYGEYDARTLQLVHNLGYGAIGWSIDTRGWQGRQAGSANDIVTRVRAGLRPGAIVLMHLGANPDDGTTYDADALPAVIAMVRAAGYGFVDLSSGQDAAAAAQG